MKTPIAVLLNRYRYRGGRKWRSAWRKLGKKRLSELYAAGFEVVIHLPKEKES